MTAPAAALQPPRLAGLPLIGNVVEFLKNPIGLIERGHKDHGRVFSVRLGNKDAVVLLGPENNRFFFEETDKLLSLREAYPFFIRMFDERLYFFADPAEYKEQRQIILPRFQGKQMDGYVTAMAREAEEFMDDLGDEGTFDLTQTLGPVVMYVAARAFLGEDFRRRMGKELFSVFRDFSGGIEAVLPLWLPLPRFKRSLRAKEKLHAMFRAAIADRRKNPVVPEDFLQTLIDAKYSDGSTIPEDLVVNLMMLLVWAGHETTVGHISWGLVDLLQNPGFLKEVLAEQEGVLGKSGDLTIEQSRQLKRMDWSLKESERLHPVAYLLMRVASQAFDVGGYHVPKGSMVFVAPWVTHRLPDVFAEPQQYDPARFSPERNEGKQPYSLIGFGGGTHRCAGVNFAYLEMKVILTLMLQRYEMELLDPDVKPMGGGVTKWPASPCRIRYKLRAGARPSARPARPAMSAAMATVPAAVAAQVPLAATAENSAPAVKLSRCPFHFA